MTPILLIHSSGMQLVQVPTGFVGIAFKRQQPPVWCFQSSPYDDQTAICGEVLGRYGSRVLLIDHCIDLCSRTDR